MTNDEILKIYNEMVVMFGDSLPNFEHHPRQFAYYVKLYYLIKKNEFRSTQ
jgi:hypothetical protein